MLATFATTDPAHSVVKSVYYTFPMSFRAMGEMHFDFGAGEDRSKSVAFSGPYIAGHLIELGAPHDLKYNVKEWCTH
jgi:hypothetical protein